MTKNAIHKIKNNNNNNYSMSVKTNLYIVIVILIANIDYFAIFYKNCYDKCIRILLHCIFLIYKKNIV